MAARVVDASAGTGGPHTRFTALRYPEPTMSAAVTAVALPASLLTTWALLRSPLAARLAAVPRGDRWHVRETPLLGGIGIAVGLAAGLGTAVAVGETAGTR